MKTTKLSKIVIAIASPHRGDKSRSRKPYDASLTIAESSKRTIPKLDHLHSFLARGVHKQGSKKKPPDFHPFDYPPSQRMFSDNP